MRSWLVLLLVLGLAYLVIGQDDSTAEEKTPTEANNKDEGSESDGPTDPNAGSDPEGEANTEPTNNDDGGDDDSSTASGFAATLVVISTAISTLIL